ncbi:MAG: hypothetical protein JJT89_13645 [Nitriliruptoraceae bacterium]|nr:hypothetical protein [Nitriliruptoraceae bacterium]
MRPARTRAALVVGLLVLAGCRGDGVEPAAGEGADTPDDITATDLPTDGWTLDTIEDPSFGPLQVPLPPSPAVWRVGDDEGIARLAAGVGGSQWWAFWGPRLEPLDPATSNVRLMIAQGGDPRTEPIAIQINVTPNELDVAPDDAEAIAEVFATIAQAQGSQVTDTRVVPVEDLPVDEVAEIAFEVDPAQLDRAVWQRFIPIPDAGLLFSIQCDGPPTAELLEPCRDALAAFAPPVVEVED